jgi:hypothetical protein
MATQPLDTGQASQALRSIVTDYGQAALSNAQFMNNVLRDLLPDRPREASVLVAAAEHDVAGILQERTAQRINPGAAVAQAAATLGEHTALTEDACLWAARQMAQALNLLPGQMTESRNLAPPPTPPPPGVTMPPAGQYQYPGNPPPGQYAAMPPAGQYPGNPPVGQYPGPTPPMSPPGSPFPPPPRGPVDPRRRQAIRIASGVAAVIVIYLLIAATAHLAPFGKAKDPVRHTASGSSPAHTASPSASPTPSSPSPTPTHTPTAADNRLLALIPTTVKEDGNCVPVQKPLFGSIASVYCHDESPIAAKVVDYYLFAKTVTMNIAYRTFLGSFAHTSEEDISCSPGKDFGKFIPKCETIYDTHEVRQGRVVEYIYKNRPDMSWTVDKHKLLIDASGNSGTRGYALLRWWTNSATHWVEGGL